MTPQIILLLIVLGNIAIASYDYGAKKQTKTSFISSLLSIFIALGILYWGGFFDVFFK